MTWVRLGWQCPWSVCAAARFFVFNEILTSDDKCPAFSKAKNDIFVTFVEITRARNDMDELVHCEFNCGNMTARRLSQRVGTNAETVCDAWAAAACTNLTLPSWDCLHGLLSEASRWPLLWPVAPIQAHGDWSFGSAWHLAMHFSRHARKAQASCLAASSMKADAQLETGPPRCAFVGVSCRLA